MSFFNYLLISVLLSGLAAPNQAVIPSEACPEIQIIYSVDQPQSGLFTLSVNPKGGKAPYIVILSKDSGQLVTEDFSKTKFEHLEKGKYTCIVVDKGRCVTKTEIQIP